MNEKLYRLMNWPEIEAIIYSEEDDPHRLLGPHREGNATVVQAFYPGAVSMELKLPGQKTVEMEQADEAGYYAALVGVPFAFGNSFNITFRPAISFSGSSIILL